MGRLIDFDAIIWHDYLVSDGNGMYHDEKIAYKSQIDDLPPAQPETSLMTVKVTLEPEEIEKVVGRIKDASIMILPSAQLPSAQMDLSSFTAYQIDWLKSHCDLELEPGLEEFVVRFLKDTAEMYEREIKCVKKI